MQLNILMFCTVSVFSKIVKLSIESPNCFGINSMALLQNGDVIIEEEVKNAIVPFVFHHVDKFHLLSPNIFQFLTCCILSGGGIPLG